MTLLPNYIKFACGWLIWHLKAGFWYLGLGLRLFFAIGLDNDYDHGKEEKEIRKFFIYPKPKFYRRYLKK